MFDDRPVQILVGDKLFTTVEPSTLLCLNKTDGKELWSAANDLEAGNLPKAQPTNGYASGTPTSDGKHVYAVFASGVVVCYEEIEGQFLIATNMFVRDGPLWKMIHHQSGPTQGRPPPPDEPDDPERLN